MTGLSLFTGIGGMDLAFEAAGGRAVSMCERDEFCQGILRQHWPDVPIYGDIKTLRGEEIGAVDIIFGGFPCQPFSVAGRQKSKDDDRYLWPEFSRLVSEIKPAWIVAENVPGILNLAADDVCQDLERQGYAIGIFCYEAAAIGALHRRSRVFFVGHAKYDGSSAPAVAGSPIASGEYHEEGAEAARKFTGTGRPVYGQAVAYSKSGRTEGFAKQSVSRACKRDRDFETYYKKTDHKASGSDKPFNAVSHPGCRMFEGSTVVEAFCGECREGTIADSERSGGASVIPISYADCERGLQQAGMFQERRRRARHICEEAISHANGERLEEQQSAVADGRERAAFRSTQCGSGRSAESLLGGMADGLPPWLDGSWWQYEPDIPRIVRGRRISSRVNRLKALGNAVVPAQIYPLFKAIMEIWRSDVPESSRRGFS